jgi:hypothetical protein
MSSFHRETWNTSHTDITDIDCVIILKEAIIKLDVNVGEMDSTDTVKLWHVMKKVMDVQVPIKCCKFLD